MSKLPVTLVHGDVHPGNMIQSTRGESVLIDWGYARIAPQYANVMKKTGFDRKKVAEIFARMKKQGKIKNSRKGVYVKA